VHDLVEATLAHPGINDALDEFGALLVCPGFHRDPARDRFDVGLDEVAEGRVEQTLDVATCLMVQGPREVEVDLLVCLLEGVAVGSVAELLGEFVGESVVVPDLVVA